MPEKENLLKKLQNDYHNLKKQNDKIAWKNSSNFILRLFFLKDTAYQELIDNDIDFTIKAKKLIDDSFKGKELSENDIKNYILSLKVYISRNEDRTKFLFVFSAIFTLSLIFYKLEILDKWLSCPYSLSLIGFIGFLMLFVLSERTILTTYKYSMEELILFLEEKI